VSMRLPLRTESQASSWFAKSPKAPSRDCTWLPNTLRCLLALVVLMRLIDCVSAATLSGKADIVDGDTIKVGGIAVRLDGIDAFETEQTCERAGKSYACGKEATKALASLISGRFPLGQSIFGCAKCTARMLGSSRAPRQMNSSINSGVLNSDP
jgi:endonuclease YncB( thermonuclease family)